MFTAIATFIQPLISFLIFSTILAVVIFVVLKLLEISSKRWIKIYISSNYDLY